MQLLGQGRPSPSAAMRKTLLLSSFACIDLSLLHFKDYSCKTLPPCSTLSKTLFHPTPAHRPRVLSAFYINVLAYLNMRIQNITYNRC